MSISRITPAFAALLALSSASLAVAEDAIPAAVAEKLQKLDQQVKILARKAEIADEEAAAKAKTSVSAFANDKDGFGIKSNDGLYKLRLRGLIQVDSRNYLGDIEKPATNTLLIRNFRPILEASLGANVDAVFVPNFAGGALAVVDLYADVKYIPGATLRVGKYVGPVGQDRIQSTTALSLPERSLAVNLTPDRDVGVQASGEFGGGSYGYLAGIFNGALDNQSKDTEVVTDNSATPAPTGDPGDSKDAAARIWVNPAKALGLDDSISLELGLAGSIGREGGVAGSNLPSYRTSGQQTIFKYKGTAWADGTHNRVNPTARLYYGPYSLVGEYLTTHQDVAGSTTYTENLNHTAYTAAVGWVVTGENATWKGVTPRAPLDPANGAWGAVEVVARASQLKLDDDTFYNTTYANGVASRAASVSRASALGVGVNWYWSRQVKLSGSYEHTTFQDGAGTDLAPTDRESERFVNARLQVAF